MRPDPRPPVLLYGPTHDGHYIAWDTDVVMVAVSTSLDNILSTLDKGGFRVIPPNGTIAIDIRNTMRRRGYFYGS